ncbi:MAG: LysR family transcriptional regulator [Rhizobiaceae bacterium]|nr:LysR family transcriptional regulator [Rhizobiaceae bacterium]
MKRKLPPLIALRAFEVVGRTSSIRAAGDELGVSHTVISRHVRHLEEYIGTNLIEQKGRGIALTSRGTQFHARINAAFADILRATDEVSPFHRRSVEVWCMPGIGLHLMRFLLEGLDKDFSKIDVSFRPTLERPDLLRGEADAEVFYLDHAESIDMIQYEELACPRVFPVASRAFLSQNPAPQSVADLLSAPLLHEQSTRYWSSWFSAAGVTDPPILPGPKLWHANFTLEAARQGKGIALANDFLIQPFRDELVELLETDVHIGSYYFIATSARRDDPEMKVLARLLRRAFGSGA